MPSTSDEVAHTLAISGLDCPDEAAVVRDALKHLPGVRGVSFDYTAGTACVRCDRANAGIEAIVAAITAAGLPARSTDATAATPDAAESAARSARHTTVGLAVAATLVAAGGFIAEVTAAGGVGAAFSAPKHGGLSLAMYGAAIGLCWIRLLPRALAAVRNRRADMYLLMLIAVLGALVLGDWLEGATVSVLFLVSLALEAWSTGRARQAIAALIGLTPTQARLRRDGQEHLVPPDTVPVGAVVIVHAGERIPVDGVVITGASHVDEAAITGESLPVERGSGDPVFAGTVNGEAVLDIQATSTATDSTMARMARLVADARQRRGATERWVDAFSARYTPAVVIIAVFVACLPPLLAGQAWDAWIYRALVLLVIACPCALVIATPVATVAALARSARMGVLIKGGEHLEMAARIRAIAFDKTGTLTTGRPVVTAVEPEPGVDGNALLAVAATLEVRSGHPLAHAVLTHARDRGVAPLEADGHTTIPGRGLTARSQDGLIWLGSPRFATERLGAGWHGAKEVGGGVIVVGRDERLLGIIRVADRARPEAAAVIADLRARGITRIVMLTGDDRSTAAAIAREVPVDLVEAELLPADKVERVAALAVAAGPVAMIGDGVNDAPALARADLGIAMGVAGSPAALETADVALMRDDLTRIPWLIDHARRTRTIVTQNITAALGAKLVFLVLTVTGHASLWAAIAADTGVSLLVTLNALRMLRGR